MIWVGIAGFFGAIARYSLGGFISEHIAGAFPWETLVINVSGCFALGFIFALMTERFLPHPTLRIALTVGFLGAYTTFSTFELETFRAASEGAWPIAAANVVGSCIAGYLALWAGFVAARML